MDAAAIKLVQDSFAKVEPISETAATLFYQRLFEVEPSVRPLFKSDIEEQGRQLMAAIALVVNRLDDLGSVLPMVQELGVRHKGYGVEDWHYDVVGGALLWTLEQGLDDGFTDDVAAAWTEAYGLLAGAMKEAASAA